MEIGLDVRLLKTRPMGRPDRGRGEEKKKVNSERTGYGLALKVEKVEGFQRGY